MLPTWTYMVLTICALGLAIYFLIGGLGKGFTTGTIVRVVVFALAGIIWLLEFRKGREGKSGEGSKPDDSSNSGSEPKG
jgi:hypothetical protein